MKKDHFWSFYSGIDICNGLDDTLSSSTAIADKVVCNIVDFIPFGFFTAYILREIKLRWVLIITLIISITIELIQAKIGIVFDIDDVILNVVGACIGYYIFSFVYKLFRK